MPKVPSSITVEELLKLELDGAQPIIEGFLYEMDNVMLVGKEKANKSTLALQIACSCSSGKPLFGAYAVTEPIDVVYLQAEGKISNTRQNLMNMMKAIECNPARILVLYYPAIQMNRPEGLKRVIEAIDAWKRPRLIIIDPLYQAMAGKIEEQESSSSMTGNLRLLSDRYQCAILLLHHAHRIKRSPDGEIINEGDDAVFGSFVWKAFPDTVLLIQKVQGNKNYRRLTCDTQRMGNIVKELDLTLVEPEPFFLKLREEGRPIDDIVLLAVKSGHKTVAEIVGATSKSRLHVSEALLRLKERGMVVANGHHPVSWAFA